MLKVNEIFGPTIQGEGKKVGTPSVFIRFGGCNLGCTGFKVEYETPKGVKKYGCDSFYAVDLAFKKEWLTFLNSSELIKEVEKYLPSYKCDLVITGGEPLLYWNNKEFQSFLEYYISKNYNVTIETNGSLDIDITTLYQKKILFSIGIKLSNCSEPLKKRINLKTLNNIINKCDNKYLKFVINKSFLEQSHLEIKKLLKHLPQVEVYLMPMGYNKTQMEENSQEVINLALKSGFKYCDRLHIRVWNDKRAV